MLGTLGSATVLWSYVGMEAARGSWLAAGCRGGGPWRLPRVRAFSRGLVLRQWIRSWGRSQGFPSWVPPQLQQPVTAACT